MVATPAAPLPPGSVLLKHHMEPAEMNQSQLAARLQVSPAEVNRLIHGHRRINVALAQGLAAIFGTTARYWLDLQSDYDLGGQGLKAEQFASPRAAPEPRRTPRPPASPPAATRADDRAQPRPKPGTRPTPPSPPSSPTDGRAEEQPPLAHPRRTPPPSSKRRREGGTTE
jgi:addiction module HigA family antidote